MRHRLPLVVALGLSAALFAVRLYVNFTTQFAWDFAINWTAATALRSGVSLYDAPALQQIGLAIVGPMMKLTFTSPYTSYIGPPTTALLYLPFSALPFASALALYRCAIAIAFGCAVVLAGYALPPRDRARGWLWGAFALLLFDPVNLSIWIGQVDAWVMLALAVSVWAYRRERWYLVGVGAGIATLLKVSPIVLLCYLVLRGRWRSVLAAAVTMLGLMGVALLAGGGENIRTFLTVVAPTLSFGSLHTENQSLPAWLARLFADATDLNDFAIGIGVYRLFGMVVGGLGILAIWYGNRSRREHALTLPLLILVALLMGPITWDHYTSWAIVALISMADAQIWAGRSRREQRNLYTMLVVGVCLLATPTMYFAPAAVGELAWLRLLTGTKTIGLLLWLGAGLWVVRAPLRNIRNLTQQPSRLLSDAAHQDSI